MNRSKIVADGELAKIVPALQLQVSRDFAPIWGVDATLKFAGSKAQPGDWELVVLDTPDDVDYLGYHETDSDSPIGFVFASLDLDRGDELSATASHEILEMLADPFILNSVVKGRTAYAIEVCDPCQDDKYGYKINGFLVSDFVTPDWFGVRVTGRFDHKRHIRKAWEILPGGYIPKTRVGRGVLGQAGRWIVARDKGRNLLESLVPKFSRRWRRLHRRAA
ncbi:MAG: hypothetical protein AB7U73_01980 [Pirellulales bacterium]